MNKLYIVNDKIDKSNLDGALEVEVEEFTDLFQVTKIHIRVLEDTTLFINYDNLKKNKITVDIDTNPNTSLKLFETRHGAKSKVQYKYKLDEYSSIEVIKFYDCIKAREYDIVELNGTGSSFKQVLKTIATEHEKYDMVIYHNAKETISKIINQGISIDEGEIIFNVTGIVPSGKVRCDCNQENRIINLNDGKNKISPNLLIDEYDVEAEHAAYIGKFNDDELFYLQSRGINVDTAISLLTEGFLKSYVDNNEILDCINKSITKYWG